MELRDFILSHDNWEELLTAAPYNLKVSRDSGYVLFKYDQIASDFNIPLVREARGIIFREADWKCVCFPFIKFGNYGESYCPEIDWRTAQVQTKIDGSLCKIWHDNGWHISTNGTIDAHKAKLNSVKYETFYDLFVDAMPLTLDDWDAVANRNYTYMFELVSPYNRVVIPYDETKLYFLGFRDMSTGEEMFPEDSEMSDYFSIPKRFPLMSLAEVQAAASKLPWDEEGYVVCDANFNRVKIKSIQYVKAHYARTNNTINTERLVQIVLDGEQEEFLIYASDYAEELHKVEEAMHKIAQNSLDKFKEVIGAQWGFSSRGGYAKYIANCPNYMKDFLFHCYDERIFWDYAKSWTAAKWVKAIEELKTNE